MVTNDHPSPRERIWRESGDSTRELSRQSLPASNVCCPAHVVFSLAECADGKEGKSLAGLPFSATKPMQHIKNAAACLVYNHLKFSHMAPYLHDLHWLPVVAHM